MGDVPWNILEIKKSQFAFEDFNSTAVVDWTIL